MKEGTQAKDTYEVIIADGITVAQGWKCSLCGMIRPWFADECACK